MVWETFKKPINNMSVPEASKTPIETAQFSIEASITAVTAAGTNKYYAAVIEKLNEASALLEAIEE